jgi:hypothetical protein
MARMTPPARLALCVLLFLASSPILRSQPAVPVEGVVFEDRDADGVRNPGEPGLAGLAVSNQVDVVTTDLDGVYRLPDPGTGVVFVSLPDGHDVRGPFWRPAAGGRADFPLVRTARVRQFTFIHASDTHVDAQSLPRMERLRAIVASRRPDFVIISGDLVRDALRVGEDQARGYYDLFVEAVAKIPARVWTVPGNHEIFGIERHLSLVSPRHPLYGKGMYRQRLGPTYYSFTYGGVRFLGLDSVDVDDLRYYGHIDARQLAWLKADLARAPAGATVVTFNHIPFVSAVEGAGGYREDGPAPSLIKVAGRAQYRHTVSNLDEVVPLLAPFQWTLALGGHLHTREAIRIESRVATRFYQTAAVVGPTTGPLPAISGVTLYRVEDGHVDDGTFIPLDDR